MKVVMVMFDSLNRHLLPPYGCEWVHAPNFKRLAERAVTFTKSYICSAPCMPARRDLHTSRPNFLHRSWGPLEPFDDSLPQILKENGVYSHLTTDHYHYFEDGGCTYHSRYQSWEGFRGQEGDLWKGQVAPEPPLSGWTERNNAMDRWSMQDRINRKFMWDESQLPQSRTFAAGIDFMRRNGKDDRWFLQIETFDPHEPYFVPRKYQDLYAEEFRRYPGLRCDWPNYDFVREDPQLVNYIRLRNAALISMCDAKLGDVLDEMDKQNLWKDTMLVVWTDHGFLLGEHNCWAKHWTGWYWEEIAHTPFFVWDPRQPQTAGQKRGALVQPAIDLGPTLLDFFELTTPPDMLGKSLAATIADDSPVRQTALFGAFGGQVNITNGRYVYSRGFDPQNAPLFEYTLMPTHMRQMFAVDELQNNIQLAGPFSFTKGCQLMKIQVHRRSLSRHPDFNRTLLFDLETDPHQKEPVSDSVVEKKMAEQLSSLMAEADAPAEQYQRLQLPLPGANRLTNGKNPKK